ncbi:DNA-3-methyladenine glycosylase family protein [Fusibacter bizertensis]
MKSDEFYNNSGDKQLRKIRDIHIESAYFDLEKTLFCGQAFRWKKVGETFQGVVGQSLIVAKKYRRQEIQEVPESNEYYVFEIYGEDFSEKELRIYFDLDRNYEVILEAISKIDQHLNEAVKYGKGIRIMRQPSFEMLISFILSSNNNIPKISMTIEALCEKFGDYLGEYHGRKYYSFPNIEQLSRATVEDLNVRAIGYRAKSIFATVQLLVNSQLDLEMPQCLQHDDAVTWLKQFHGVGNKVANCILLFGYGDDMAFPIDTWVKRMLSELYGVEKKHEAFVETYFTEHPGIAQQYLFYYIRKG